MISESFNRRQFIEAMMEKDYLQILFAAEAEVYAAEGIRRPAKSPRVKTAAEYAAFLKAFLFFMRYGIKPGGILDYEFLLFRPLCEKLVQKGQFKPSVLDFFKKEVLIGTKR
jgi:hypothetical protein